MISDQFTADSGSVIARSPTPHLSPYIPIRCHLLESGFFCWLALRRKHCLRAAARSGCGCLFQSVERKSQRNNCTMREQNSTTQTVAKTSMNLNKHPYPLCAVREDCVSAFTGSRCRGGSASVDGAVLGQRSWPQLLLEACASFGSREAGGHPGGTLRTAQELRQRGAGSRC